MFGRLLMVLSCAVVLFASKDALAFTAEFPGSTAQWSGGVTLLVNFGDYVEETYTGTGLSSVSSISLSFHAFQSNNVDMNLLLMVNGDVVSGLIDFPGVTDETASIQTVAYNFSPIAADADDAYTIEAYVFVPTDIGGLILRPAPLALSDDVGVSPVPEPALWSLMLVGFSGLGSVLRRRSLKPPSAA